MPTTRVPSRGDGRRSSPVEAATIPWWLATFPRERLRSSQPEQVDHERGRRRLDWWLELAALGGPAEELDPKLRPLQVGADELAALLGEEPSALGRRLATPPAWFEWFAAAWEVRPSVPDADATLPPNLGLLEVARPLLGAAQRQLRAALDGGPAPRPELAALPALLGASLPLAELGTAVGPAMVLELNVARLVGRLQGATPGERLAGFLAGLGDPEASLRVWREYPVLARYVVETLTAWVETRSRFAERLAEDFELLRQALWHGGDPGELVAVEFGAGDSHAGGQSVALLRFEHGGAVYKPRPLGVDDAFGRVLELFNGDDPAHRLRLPTVVDRGAYGWTELVRADPCRDHGDARAFYWRLGALLALLHGLAATDLHSENVIAAGAHPMLVDLEVMFQPDVAALMAAADHDHRPDPAAAMLGRSVLTMNLLPVKMVVDDHDEAGRSIGVDLSGMGGDGGQRSFVPVPVLQDPDGDAMRFVTRHVEMPGTENRPRFADGTVVEVGAFQADLTAGFRHAYRWLVRGRRRLLDPHGPVAAFAGVRVRMVPRPTYLYGQVLLDSLHPDFLRDAMERARCLARLCEGWAGAPGRERLVGAEIRALARGDIPVFRIRPGSRDLWLDDGTVVPDVLPRPPLQEVGERIGALDEDDLAHQLRVIDGCLTAFALGEAEQGWPGYAAPLAAAPLPAERLVEAAAGIGRRLDQLAVEDADGVGWLSLVMVDERHWLLGTAGLDAYSGMPGIGLFLSYLAQQTGDERVRALAERVTQQVVRHLRAHRRGFDALAGVAQASRRDVGAGSLAVRDGFRAGAFGPLLGPIYYLAHASSVQRRPELLTAALDLLPLVRPAIDADHSYDLVNGSAGCILALLAVHRLAPDSEALALARHAAERLLAARVPAGSAGGWRAAGMGDRPLAGLSHGASGPALALARLHAVQPDPRYLEAVDGALRYEDGLFDRRARNWPDLRPDTPEFMTTWCYGAPGIGLARLELLGHDFLDWRRPVLEADLRHAAASTAAAGLRDDPVTGIGNHSICHGDLGNLELLGATVGTPYEAVPATRLSRALASLVGLGQQEGWVCGVPSGKQTPGLMTGLAGIGYNLLRLADPDAVPSVLLLQPPRPAAAGRPGR